MPPRPLTAAGLELSKRIQKNSAASLGRYFRRLANASLATSLVVSAAGCASAFPQSPGEDGFEAPVCNDHRVALLHDIDPAVTDYDYLAAWTTGVMVPEAELWDEVGTRCATASDAAACEAALTESVMIGGQHLVSSAGDAITRYQTHEELMAFLGEIDTAQEAVLVIWHAGYSLSCEDISRGAVREVEGGWEVVATRLTAGCDPVETTTYILGVARDGTITEIHSEVTESLSGVCIGRRPAAMHVEGGYGGDDRVGAFFSEVAHLEASAVFAFRILAHELHAHGAPLSLVRAARDAAEDEVRHAEAMTRVARRFGAEPAQVRVDSRPVRSLYEIALDNACEGCVRETFGALLGTHQAAAASDPEIAAALRVIAEDETRHAALSWAIAEWVEPRLTEEERERVRAARARAVIELRAEMAAEPDPGLVRTAGLPDAAHAVALVDRVASDLFS